MFKRRTTVGNYVLCEKLGEGASGQIYKAKNSNTGDVYAVKVIDRGELGNNSKSIIRLNAEVAIMKYITHPNILHLYDFFESDSEHYLITDFCDQGDLESYLKREGLYFLDERISVEILKQIANGFQELRKHQILHRDFKLSNILLKNGRVVIGDFGMSKIGDTLAESRLGTPFYTAYEILRPSYTNTSYNSLVDLWSLGVVYYKLLFGEHPFYGSTISSLVRDIEKKANGKMQYPGTLSDMSKDLLDRIFVTDPKARLDWNSFFNHDLFQSYKQFDSYSPEKIHKSLWKKLVKNQQIVDMEFMTNKNFKPDQEFKFMDEEEIVEYGLLKQIKPMPILENCIFWVQRISSVTNFGPLGCFYEHEAKKIEFIFQSANSIDLYSAKCEIIQISAGIRTLALLFFEKALTLSILVSQDLSTRKNRSNFGKEFFDQFILSDGYPEALLAFDGYQNMILENLEKLSNTTQEYKSLMMLYNKKERSLPDLKEVDSLLLDLYIEIRDFCALYKSENPMWMQDLLIILTLARISIDCQDHLPFKDKITKEVFAWESFFNKYHNPSMETLYAVVFK